MQGSNENPLDLLPPLRSVIAEFGLDARRSLGQHFLLDLNLTRRIANGARDLSAGTTIEVGPGPGGLTRSLLAAGAAQVIAVERDERCVAALQPLVAASEGRLRVLAFDALTFDITTAGPPPLRIVANLPYNIATPLLINWLKLGPTVSEMVLMFQLEVAERIVAKPGSKVYGRLSVLSNWCADTRLLFRIPARAFTPSPRVDSAVVRFAPHPEALYAGTLPFLEAVTAAAFGQRRKTLRRSLVSLGVPVSNLLDAAAIDGSRRAEELSVEEFANLAEALSDLRGAP
jgi:16S rRNA (adenine1518-N6/adenine1519-N6)-dimethyltransferase